MKSFKLSLLIFALLTFVGCTNVLTGMDYHDLIVAESRGVGQSVDVTMNAYDLSVPVTLDEDSVVDVSLMKTALEEARNELNQIPNELMLVKTWDLDRKKDVQAAMTDYFEVTQSYLNHYSNVIDFYSGDFTSNLHLVLGFDKELYEHFNAHVDVHNALSLTLSSHQ